MQIVKSSGFLFQLKTNRYIKAFIVKFRADLKRHLDFKSAKLQTHPRPSSSANRIPATDFGDPLIHKAVVLVRRIASESRARTNPMTTLYFILVAVPLDG